MRMLALICGVSLCLLLNGCFTSMATLNASHIEANFERHLIKKSAWSIDRASFASASSIEILSFGGDDAYSSATERPKADFYPTIEKNAQALMGSLFGDEGADRPPGSAPYLLRVKVGRVETKAAMWAYQEAQTTIGLEFILLTFKDGQEHVVFSTLVTRTAKGDMGTAYSIHSNAHERANRAINEAFIEAQKQFITTGL